MHPMVRFGVCALLGSVIFLMAGPLPSAYAQAAANPEAAIDTALRVQKAMAQADACLLGGDPKKAVEVLEAELPRINGNRKYLAKLRDAYRAYVPKLYADRQPALAQRYLERLCILDRTAATDPALQPSTVERPVGREAKTVLPPSGRTPTLAELAQNSGAPPAAGQAAVRLTPTVRAKIDDPFDPAHAAAPPSQAVRSQGQRAQELLALAEAAFRDRHFNDALRYFDQAHQADETSTSGSRERWAYCMLSHVVDALNQPNLDAAAWADLQREVEAAMVLAPCLGDTARWLQTQMRSRRNADGAGQQGAVAVRHLGSNAQGWEVAETANFRIFHKQPRSLVEKTAQVAEATRTDMYRKWFGRVDDTWSPKCDLYLHATAQDYSRITLQSTGSPGHSRIETDRDTGRVVARRMDMHCDNPNTLDAVLPHETTHVVLAGQFGKQQVPRWADEGMAVLAEPKDKVDLHRRNLARCYRDGLLLGIGELMQLADYPQPRQIGAFYAQSVSLVEYLSQQRGPVVFSQFVRDGLREGYEAALRRHYGFRDFAELQHRWSQQALARLGDSSTSVAER
jgi:hypothetical protein